MQRGRFKPDEELTPFARLIRDYLFSFKPTKTVADLARETGITSQTIWDWMHNDVVPRRATILQLHDSTGIALNDLYRAAGIADDEEEAWQRIEQFIENEDRLPQEKRKQAVAAIHGLRMEYHLDSIQAESASDQ